MTALSAVRDAWDAVFASSTLQSYTTNFYTYDLAATTDKSISNSALMMLNNEINFIQATFAKSSKFEMCNELLSTFNIVISYYREIDNDGTNYHAITDFFDSLLGVVLDEVGTDWDGTIDYFQPGDVTLGVANLDSRDCWTGRVQYEAKVLNEIY